MLVGNEVDVVTYKSNIDIGLTYAHTNKLTPTHTHTHFSLGVLFIHLVVRRPRAFDAGIAI